MPYEAVAVAMKSAKRERRESARIATRGGRRIRNAPVRGEGG